MGEATFTCPICEDQHSDRRQKGREDAYHYSCGVCGRFLVSGTLKSVLAGGKYRNTAYILSGFIKNATTDVVRWENENVFSRSKINEVELHSDKIDEIIRDAPTPQNPIEMMDRFLLWMSKPATPPDIDQNQNAGREPDLRAHFYRFFDLNPETNYPLVYAVDNSEFIRIRDLLISEGFIEGRDGSRACRLTLKGWQRVEEIRKFTPDSNQAFVATWFDDRIDPIYKDSIKPALEEFSYKPIWMKILEHNGKIDDRITAEIRRSGLVVADFTGNRQGVYYEAGFAKGLGIPVIWTCKKGRTRLHFDTRQYNHILWTNAEDLKVKLIDRIGATIPGRSRRTTEKNSE